MSQIYRLQKFTGNSYHDFDDDYLEYNTESIGELSAELVEELSLLPFFNKIHIPKVVFDLVTEFLSTYSLPTSPEKFFTLIGGAQRAFLGNRGLIGLNQDGADFFTERRELRELLNLIKDYRFSREKLDLQSIRFIKSQNKIAHSFKNTWILQRVFEGLILKLNLDASSPEEFDKQAEVEIAMTNLVSPSKAENYIKGITIKAFHYYLSDLQNVSERFKNSCAGILLNCAQIPLTENPVILSNTFEDNITETSPEHVRLLVQRLQKNLL